MSGDQTLALVSASALEPLNLAFLIVIIGVALLALVGIVLGQRVPALARLRDVAPGLLTGIGILGTFVGIFLGLLRFDVSNAATIQTGVPALLDGMKTAFLTSVAGLLSAMSVKLLVAMAPRHNVARGATASDILAALQELRRDSVSEARELRSAIVGDGTSSIVSQLRAMRDEARESREQIVKSVDEIGRVLAESATKALIAALEDAIKDFNQRITEQFGSNFAQLNTAVGKLLEWQEQYRTQMSEMIAQFERSATAARDSAAAMARIAAESAGVVRAAEALAQLVADFARIRADVDARLAAFAGLADQAGKAMPLIEANLANMTKGMEREVQKALNASSASADALKAQSEATAAQMAKFRQDAQQLVESSSARLKEVMDGFARQSTEVVSETAKRLEQAQSAEWDRLRRAMSAATEQTTTQINKNFSELDRALQQELTKALEALGGRLAAVTRGFADDFTRAIGEFRRAARSSQP